MEYFVQQIANGVTLGCVYALVAIGFSLVYTLLRVLNFAHGSVYMLGAFAGFGVISAAGGMPVVPLLLLVLLAGMAAACVAGVAMDRYAFRPLRNAPKTAPLLVGVGVGFFVQSVVLVTLGAEFRRYDTPSLAGGDLTRVSIDIGPLHLAPIRAITIAVAIGLMVALAVVIARTRLGRAIRATGHDPEAAAMMGVSVEGMIIAGFAIASALAGAAGALAGLALGSIHYLMGFTATLKGFSAAVIGGLGSLPGAIVGGLAIGIAEALVVGYLTTVFQDMFVFAILILVILVRPTGLLGRPELQKV
jgi:branched-chain amino acid transport system permease protein